MICINNSCYQEHLGFMATSCCQHHPQERYLLAIQQAATWKTCEWQTGCDIPNWRDGVHFYVSQTVSNRLHPSNSKMRNQLAPASNLFLDVQPCFKFGQF